PVARGWPSGMGARGGPLGHGPNTAQEISSVVGSRPHWNGPGAGIAPVERKRKPSVWTGSVMSRRPLSSESAASWHSSSTVPAKRNSRVAIGSEMSTAPLAFASPRMNRAVAKICPDARRRIAVKIGEARSARESERACSGTNRAPVEGYGMGKERWEKRGELSSAPSWRSARKTMESPIEPDHRYTNEERRLHPCPHDRDLLARNKAPTNDIAREGSRVLAEGETAPLAPARTPSGVRSSTRAVSAPVDLLRVAACDRAIGGLDDRDRVSRVERSDRRRNLAAEGADDLVVDVARLPCAVVDVGAIRLAGSAFDAPSAK